jgi:hypothetical protein
MFVLRFQENNISNPHLVGLASLNRDGGTFVAEIQFQQNIW